MKYILISAIIVFLFGCSNRYGYSVPDQANGYIIEVINKNKEIIDDKIRMREMGKIEELMMTIELVQRLLVERYDEELNDLGYILSVRLCKAMGHRIIKDDDKMLFENQLKLIRSFKPDGIIVF